MKDFDYILDKVLKDRKFSRSEGDALDQVLEAGKYNEAQLAFLRSKLFDHVKEMFPKKEDRDLIDCLEKINKALLPTPERKFTVEATFSPGMDCLDAINRQLRRAKSTIDICVFTISDDRIVEEILSAHNRRVKVRIVTDDEKQYDKGNDVFRMKRAGVPIVTDSTPDHMHHKFAVIDNSILICGSYNWTRSAATRNNEDVIVTDHAAAVHAFSAEFERLWKEFSR